MNLSAAMCMQRKNVKTALQSFIAAVDVQPTLIISMEALMMLMILDANCRKSGLSVPS